MEKKVYIYDATLREGSQKIGINFSVEDKIRILERIINDLHLPMIEVGWPGSNPKDVALFKKIQTLENNNGTRIFAFGSTRRKGIRAAEDRNLQALLAIGIHKATIFGKSWDLHVETALETTLEENLNMIEDTIMFLNKNGIDVVYDAEHFFDGYKHNKKYALETISCAYNAGASWIVLCDTNGGLLPHELEPIFSEVKDRLGDASLGIHAHNDLGLANAIALEAYRQGAQMIQGTMNGFGERCGNTDITSILPILKIKMDVDCISKNHLKNLTEVSHFVDEMANLQANPDQPFVGKNAFSHKGGVHISAMRKDHKTYEHINPSLVGNMRNIKVSELAGKSSILHMAKKFGIPLTEENPKVKAILKVIKEKENQGYAFEGAEGSLEIIMRSMDMNIQDPNYYRNKFFKLEGFRVLTEMYKDNLISEATIKVKVEGKEFHTAADGNGPVNALDNALKKALAYFYPSLNEIDLSDFKVRIINQAGTASKVRVLAETYDKESSWGTIGAHGNIIVASWDALVDSYIFKVLKDKTNW
ncbi:MAG: citramalate synthase [Candidatus Lokiarchaeota archaeon]|nr:citramalate synthase [Candidatus Lokiarchaeota archaeon]MBD3338392.1 citramalate synthase [Candidatus Lokiarchaeota archaeon]